MKSLTGRYFLGRVVKGGVLSQDGLLEAIRNPPVITVGKYKWTIIGVTEGVACGSPYIFGCLAKYDGEGEVTVVKESSRESELVNVQDLIVAESPFVYFREFSGIAYLHVWNSIEEKAFRSRFSKIIREKYEDFFVDCGVEVISDIHTFTEKIIDIEKITSISAKVVPPNPLFGACWKSLNEYIKNRNATIVEVKEKSDIEHGGLKSTIKDIISLISKNKILEANEAYSITDAAILMATDGYGKGAVSGVNSYGKEIVVRTLDAQKSFLFPKNPDVQVLAEEVYQILNNLVLERRMQHASH